MRTSRGRRAFAGGDFDGFISYSHEADRRLAGALRSGLHRFAKPWYRLRALRIFQDDSTLASDVRLWDPIAAALDRSSHLILLASRTSARSRWVSDEVVRFLDTHSADRLVILKTDGSIVWDEQHRDLDWSATDALPVALRGRIGADPRYIDVTWSRSQDQLSLKDPTFADLVAGVAAALRGTSKDALHGEDVAQHRRTLRVVRSVVAALTALALALLVSTLLAVAARDDARRERDVALSRQLAAQSELEPGGRLDLALLLAVHARRVDDGVEARSALLRALQRRPELAGFLDRGGPPVTALATSPDRNLIAWGGDDARIRFWSPRAGVAPEPLPNTRPVGDLAFSPDGRRLAVGGTDGHVDVWDLATRRVAAPLPDALGQVKAVTFSPDGRFLAAGGLASASGSALVVYDGSATRRLDRQPVERHGVQDLAFSPDSTMLVAAAGEVVRWSTSTWDRTGSFVADGGEAAAVAFRGDGHLLAASGNSPRNSAVLVDPTSFTVTGNPLMGHTDRVDTLAFSPDGRTLVTGGQDNGLITWDVATRRSVKALPAHADDVRGTAFLNDHVLVSAGEDGAVERWDLNGDTWGRTAVVQAGGAVESVAYLGTPGRLLTATTGGTSTVWDADRGTPLRQLSTGNDPFGHYAVASADGNRVASADLNGAGAVRDAAGRLLRLFPTPRPDHTGLILEPEQPLGIDRGGHTVAVAMNGRLTVIDVDGGAELLSVATGASTVAVSPDGATVVIADQDGVSTWRRAGSRFVPGQRGGGGWGRPVGLAFSPDGGILAVCAGTEVRLLRMGAAPVETTVLRLHEEAVTAGAFSADGRLLATGDRRGALLLWDVPTRQVIGSLRSSGGGVVALAFSPDSSRLASSAQAAPVVPGSDGVVRGLGGPAPPVEQWDVSPDSWAAEACAVAGLDLTVPEWTAQVGDAALYRRACTLAGTATGRA